jgi:hypothetical protein
VADVESFFTLTNASLSGCHCFLEGFPTSKTGCVDVAADYATSVEFFFRRRMAQSSSESFILHHQNSSNVVAADKGSIERLVIEQIDYSVIESNLTAQRKV